MLHPPGGEYPLTIAAILPSGKLFPPTSYLGGFHGVDSSTDIDKVFQHGLPARGSNFRIFEHVFGLSGANSAFRGTTASPLISNLGGLQAGAAHWAGDGGWVLEIRDVPTWGVDEASQADVPVFGIVYTGIQGECEYAIPAEVHNYRVYRAAPVSMGRRNNLTVGIWRLNPNF